MRILTIGHSYVIDLNRRLCRELALVGRPHTEVTAVAPLSWKGEWGLLRLQPSDQVEPYRLEAVPIHFSIGRLPQVFLYGRGLKALLREPWDIVHCAQEPYVLAAGQVARWVRPTTKLVYSTYQNIAKRYPPPFAQIERYAMGKAAGWIPMARTAYEAMKDRPGQRDKAYRILPPGVDVGLFRPDPSARLAIRGQLGWSEGDRVVGFLGRFVEEKGIRQLCKALESLDRLGWKALLVGSGPLEGELREWAGGRSGRVWIANGVRHSEVPGWLNAMDLLVAPSQTTARWREQFGRMLIEAMACGVPIVASDSGEIPYVVDEAGIIVKESDVGALAGAIGELVESPGRCRDLACRGLERARTLFDWPVVAKAHLTFFEELM